MVETVTLGSTGLSVTRVGFGGIPIMRLPMEEGVRVVRDVIGMGINFIDTANVYGDSEEKIGRAICGFTRETLVIASKSMARDCETFARHIDLSLQRLRTDYIDIYYIHALRSEEDIDAVMGKNGAMEALKTAMKIGKVRHAAFSSHNADTAIKIMRTGEFEVVQFPFNFIDREAENKLIPLAEELNMGFVAMKPLGGGLLNNARLCFRFLLQYNSIVPDPGIENSNEMREILDVITKRGPLSADEKKQMKCINLKMGKSWCHRCDYCRPCPEGIGISSVLIAKSIVRRMPFESAFEFLHEAMEKARHCTECRTCVGRCPYELDIPKLLRKNLVSWDKYRETKDSSVFE
jgi:predicted aldo/keto reductase-like oxidoreductase